ncbi:MAG: NAD(P)H-dependent oxidoreductase subunit E [Clostridiales bacterium]|nr:NAD(P)H-dependent oxidoreductase subunit E [Clostridiales bacterium]
MNIELDASKCCCAQEKDEQKYKRFDSVISGYKDKEGNLIQILHYAQGIFGCISPELQEYIAEKTGIPVSKVHGVVTFYAHFSTEPKGEHIIKVCMGTACFVLGAKDIVDALSDKLGIGVGETTKDGKYTLEVTRCIGACGLAPVMTIDDVVYQQVDKKKVEQILNNEEVKEHE